MSALANNRKSTMGQPLRILHVVHGLPHGGLENGVVNLANRLPPVEFTQAICCLDNRGSMADRVSGEVPIFVMNRRRHDLALPFRLAALIERWQPDLVHCRNWNAWPDTVAAHALARGRRRRLVWSFHGFADGDRFPRRRSLASRLLAWGTDRLFAVCRHSAGIFAARTGIPLRRFEVLYNGVDTRRFAPPADPAAAKAALGLPAGEALILTVGSLTPVKDHHSLVEAIARLPLPDNFPVRFLFLGEGALRPALEARIEALGLEHRISMPGSSDRVADYLAAADAFVLPSRLEGMSNAILEAMASGLPVVARAVGGNPELVIDGETGILCPPDDIPAMAAAIAGLAADGDLRRRLGSAARRRAEEAFSSAAMVSAYSGFYRRTVEGA